VIYLQALSAAVAWACVGINVLLMIRLCRRRQELEAQYTAGLRSCEALARTHLVCIDLAGDLRDFVIIEYPGLAIARCRHCPRCRRAFLQIVDRTASAGVRELLKLDIESLVEESA